jgi:hypothetical protein
MADTREYAAALDKAILDLETRVLRRDILNAEIAGLRETVRVLSGLIAVPPDKQKQVALLLAMVDSATPTLTDAVRSLLTRAHPKEMTATEIRNALENSNFDFGDFSNPLSACHSALKRLETDGQIEKGKPKEGKVAYRTAIHLDRPNAFYELLLSTTKTKDFVDTSHLRNLAALAALDTEEKKKLK